MTAGGGRGEERERAGEERKEGEIAGEGRENEVMNSFRVRKI